MWIYIIYMINAIVVMVILVLKCILGNLSRADDELEDEMMPAEEPAAHNGTNGAATIVEERKLRVCPEVPHNWSDFFFILDLLAGGAVDRCELLIFLGRTEDL